MNEIDSVVDEIIFIFCDKEEGEIVGERSVKTTGELGCLLTICNAKSASALEVIQYNKSYYMQQGEKDSTRDWLDFLYDRIFDSSRDLYKAALNWDIENREGSFRVLIDEDNDIERMSDKIALNQAISRMQPLWQKIVLLRYYRDMTQQQTADRLGLSQVKVSREEKKIMAFLREQLVN
jgi:RNA polymerase sigma factor (sigma-70 family)